MRCIVQKFGGACFVDRDHITQVARQVGARGGLPVALVISARKGATDRLLAEAAQFGAPASAATTDTLLATGELHSAALVAAALEQLGQPSVVVPPWTVFRTDANFGNATIRAVRVRRVRDCLARGIVPIVPGFVGAEEQGRLTTLGRGGSDYSAVALAAALGAERVELCKAEVDGVYDVDPHRHGAARRFDRLTHAAAVRIARAGGKVLQEKAAVLALRRRVPVLVRPAFGSGPGTWIGVPALVLR